MVHQIWEGALSPPLERRVQAGLQLPRRLKQEQDLAESGSQSMLFRAVSLANNLCLGRQLIKYLQVVFIDLICSRFYLEILELIDLT